eukprot:EG_transcript_13405
MVCCTATVAALTVWLVAAIAAPTAPKPSPWGLSADPRGAGGGWRLLTDGQGHPVAAAEHLWANAAAAPHDAHIVALASPVCACAVADNVLSLRHRGGRCAAAAPPFLVSTAAIARHGLPPRPRAIYPEARMPWNLLEYFIRVGKQLRIHTVPRPVDLPYAPQLVPGRSLLSSLRLIGRMHEFWAIEEPDGRMAWLECGRHPRICQQRDPSAAPPPLRPPCCPFLLKQLLFALADVFQTLAAPFFVCGGALLGAVRNQKFIPWDDDVDVVLERVDELYLTWAKALEAALNSSVYVQARRFYYKVYLRTPWRTPPAPIAPRPALAAMHLGHHRRLVFMDVMNPAGLPPLGLAPFLASGWPWKGCLSVTLEGRQFCGPDEASRLKYFRHLYGDNWQTPEYN